MLNILHFIYGVFSLFAIIYMCILFTNAIEHLGKKLQFGSSATGSILAVIGTTLPETIVPLVAIFTSGVSKVEVAGGDIALGAIIGSPFMLSTLAMFLSGAILFLVLLSKKRKSTELSLNYSSILRNYKYFITSYIIAFSLFFTNSKIIKILAICILLIMYIVYVYRTIIKSKENLEEEELEELIFSKAFKCFESHNMFAIILQIIVSLTGLIVSSDIFVFEINHFSILMNIPPLVLSLIVTPFATELPECVNSIIWVKNGKDELAMANITGAVVFQASVLFSIGIILTPWEINNVILYNNLSVIACSLIFAILLSIFKKIKLSMLFLCGVFYFGYLYLLLILK